MSMYFCISGPSPFWNRLQIILAEGGGHGEGRQGPLDLLRVSKASHLFYSARWQMGAKSMLALEVAIVSVTGSGDGLPGSRMIYVLFTSIGHSLMVSHQRRFEKETFTFMLRFSPLPLFPSLPLHITRCIESLQNNP